MVVKGRRGEYAATTRSAIVAAAIERFSADGFAKATIDAVADTARVSKGAVYHHFADKTELFVAAFVAMEERLLDAVASGVSGIDDPWELARAGVDIFLTACCEADFRRIALEEAPAALGWTQWKHIEERYFLGLVTAALDGLARAGYITVPPGELTARMWLAAMAEAGLALAAATSPSVERQQVGDLVMRLLDGFRIP